ncbi:hypothetical protein [Anaeromyxobacter dehalogenans]|uniref:Bacteriophage lambda Replication protein O N-terminal domain-containing protein n=1 Tax=Anaeromyxobacter dehalogenans (strain 2CP-C) TaxID=290397 RepID=Q2IKU6_ANADE|nr:hypothetical protein [Anaeromyxobacter dehalogenans]ABC82278.1 hypothetical protein Adeh_2508 [Anaeromyxobacter dehalogenans 2CP-C]
MARADRFYRGVRGSAALATRPLAAGAIAAEALEPGEMRRLPFEGELLGAARVRAAFVAIPLDAFDAAATALEAEEQAAYLHLLRLSFGEGRNWCRAAKRDLMARLRLSERRLLRVLDALVEKRFARPLHRDNRGTLWRVYLPREAAGQAPGDEVLLGRAVPAALPIRAPDVPAPHAPVPRAPAAPPPAAAGPEAALARALRDARGEEGPDALGRALRDVRDLLAEGQSASRIAAAIDTVRRRAARAAQKGPP